MVVPDTPCLTYCYNNSSVTISQMHTKGHRFTVNQTAVTHKNKSLAYCIKLNSYFFQAHRQGTSFSISNPSYENVVFRKPKTETENKENRSAFRINHQDQTDSAQGSLDSTETKPKLAKLVDHNAEETLNSSLPDFRDGNDGPPCAVSNSHSVRSRSQDPLPNSRAIIKKKVVSSADTERHTISKSQSFPQHSAPVKKGK